MGDLESNDDLTEAQDDQARPDAGRRRAVTYLAIGAGLAVAGLLTPKDARAYYGRCWKCNCCGFEGTENNCSNCGHRYDDHSGQTCERNP